VGDRLDDLSSQLLSRLLELCQGGTGLRHGAKDMLRRPPCPLGEPRASVHR
jgi:hypothetical protein